MTFRWGGENWAQTCSPAPHLSSFRELGYQNIDNNINCRQLYQKMIFKQTINLN